MKKTLSGIAGIELFDRSLEEEEPQLESLRKDNTLGLRTCHFSDNNLRDQ